MDRPFKPLSSIIINIRSYRRQHQSIPLRRKYFSILAKTIASYLFFAVVVILHLWATVDNVWKDLENVVFSACRREDSRRERNPSCSFSLVPPSARRDCAAQKLCRVSAWTRLFSGSLIHWLTTSQRGLQTGSGGLSEPHASFQLLRSAPPHPRPHCAR